MAETYEKRVRARAHRLWQEAGSPEGGADTYRDQARELVAIEDNQNLTTQPVGQPGEPVEWPEEAVENEGEFPTLTDQGEGQAYPAWPGDKGSRKD